MSKPIDHYAVLGVVPTSDEVVIRAAYRALMLKFHPDTNKSEDATKRAAAINAAFAVLGDAVKRKAYDDACLDYATRNSRTTSEAASPPTPPPDPPKSSPGDVSQNPPGGGWWTDGRWIAVGIAVLIVGALAYGERASSSDGGNAPANAAAFLEELADTTSDNMTIVDGALPASIDAPENASDLLNGSFELSTYSKNAPPPPLKYDTIESAAATFEKVLNRSGIVGARAWSKKCHAEVENNPSWEGADRCAAFDFAARYIDSGMSRYGVAEDGYFKFQAENQSDNYTPVTNLTFSLNDRLRRIQSSVGPATYEAVKVGISRRNSTASPNPSATEDSEGDSELGEDWLDKMTGKPE